MPGDPPNEGGQPVQAVQAPIFTSNVPVPQKIELSGNLANNWKQWKQVWSAYELVTRLNEQTDEYRVAAFITCIGPKALTIHNGLPFQSEDEKKNLAKILELWESYCLGKTNIIYERYRFNNRNQDVGESIDTYASNLRSLSDTCNFGPLKDEMIRDRIVCGVRDSSLRKKLLQVPELTLEKCIDMCRSAEATSTQLEAMSSQNSHAPPPPEVNFVKKPSKVKSHVHAGRVKIRRGDLPWMNSSIRKELNKRYKLLLKAQKTQKGSQAWIDYKKARNQCTKLL